ncbi:MAG: stage II sporulation protein R [Eubacterium sp.]|nr:stage II sporulation protein R [Eubacterium sp.]
MKKLTVFTSVFLVLTIFVSAFTSVINMSESISNKVFRLHILANSDEKYDQELKLKVRDKILSLSKELYNDCESVDEAINVSKDNLDLFRETAQKVIAFYGFEYEARPYVTKEYFNTRKYDNFSLPAGIYDCLKIEIGQGKGKNWWCVMFPSVCISGCTDDFNGVLTEDERRMIEEDKYIVKFKAVEIYEKLKNRFR